MGQEKTRYLIDLNYLFDSAAVEPPLGNARIAVPVLVLMSETRSSPVTFDIKLGRLLIDQLIDWK